MSLITLLRSVVTGAGATPAFYDRIRLLRQLVTAYGGTPTKWKTKDLLQQAIIARGGTPPELSNITLWRALISTFGVTPASYEERALIAQLAGLVPGGGSIPSTINPALTPPEITLAVGQTTYPPQFDISSASLLTAAEGDIIWIRRTDDDDGLVNPVFYSHLITAGDLAAPEPRTWTFPGLSSIASGTYRYWPALSRGSVRSNYGTMVRHGPNDVAPAVTAVAGSSSLPTTATVTFTTNWPDGTAYAVATTSSTPPSAATIESTGTSLAITSAGSGKTINLTGLTAGTTYWAHVIHKPAVGPTSPVATSAASFNTPAASVFSLEPVDEGFHHTPSGGGITRTGVNFGAPASDRYILVYMSGFPQGSGNGLDVNGVAATKLDTNGNMASLFIAPVPTGTTGTLNSPIFSSGDGTFKVWRLTGANPTPTEIAKFAHTWSPSPRSVTVNTPASGKTVIFGAFIKAALGETPVWTNATGSNASDDGNAPGSGRHYSVSAFRTTAGSASVSVAGFSNGEGSLTAVSFAP